jgi:arylsulfatase A-like enzyme
VPILLKPPGGYNSDNPAIEPGTKVAASASLLDLCPTMLEIAGVETGERRDGISLLKLAETDRRPENYPLLFEGGNHVVPNICVALLYESQAQRYLYTYNVMDAQDQLYRLSGRAGENRNLLPDRADLAEEAARRLYSVLEGGFGVDPVPGQDPRWIVYRECLRLEKGRLLPLSEGDGQIFWR